MLIITTRPTSERKLRPRTHQASAARRQTYDEEVKRALPFIELAEADGSKNAELKAQWLNRNAVPATSNESWTVDAVLRCLRRLKVLGLHRGSPPPSVCRVLDERQYARRMDAEKRAKSRRAANNHLTQNEMIECARATAETPVTIAPRIVEDEL